MKREETMLTATQINALRLCDNVLGFYAADMSGPEKRTTMRLKAMGLVAIPDGKKAFITDAGRTALAGGRS